MNHIHVDELDRVRHASGELQNHIIDELTAGHLSRRQFVKRASVAGLSATAIGAVLTACGGANSSNKSSSSASGAAPASTGKKGGTMRVAQLAPVASMNPLTVSDAGGLNLLAQVGEYLTFDNDTTEKLEPMLATSWSPNSTGTEWTFKLRQGVKFHNGQTMSADDVVYTFKQISDPHNASNALSTLGGILTPDGVSKVDASTVRFKLHGPNGNFPYAVSSDNYNAIIVPAGTDYGKWQQTWIGTGAFKYVSYSTNNGASFAANPVYWGPKPLLSQTKFTFYGSQQPQVLALQGGQVDLINGIVPTGAEALLTGSQYKVFGRTSSGHREISMRCDQPPFNDPRVRRAVALTLDRPGMISSLMSGKAVPGNDSPFAPKFPSTDLSVPQRKQDIAQAKQLLAQAGHPRGFSATYTSEVTLEMPGLAQIVQQNAKLAGIDFKLDILQQSSYYGKSTFGSSPWLDSTVSAVDYGDRGTPNIFLQAALTSQGIWNAAHFKDPAYDKLVTQYVGETDLSSQRATAGKIEQLLLDQTPLMIPYFITALFASNDKVSGVNPSSVGAVWLGQASIA
ncbi:MAG: ABC transporter substrate-binding protein [Solirubrobacteraceae bacterium]